MQSWFKSAQVRAPQCTLAAGVQNATIVQEGSELRRGERVAALVKIYTAKSL